MVGNVKSKLFQTGLVIMFKNQRLDLSF